MKFCGTCVLVGVVGWNLFGGAVKESDGADPYLRSLEDRIAALEQEVQISRSDLKGKGNLNVPPPVYIRPKSSYVTKAQIRGMLQWQWGQSVGSGRVAGSHGSYSTMEIRRARLGVEGKLADNFEFLVEATILPGVVNLHEAYLRWKAAEEFQPLVGYIRPRFGFEEMTSSGKILTVERTLINDQFCIGQLPGVLIEGDFGIPDYSIGIFNGTRTGVPLQPGRPEAGSYLMSASVGLDLETVAGFPLGCRFDYMNVSADGINQQPYGPMIHNFDLSAYAVYGPFDLRVEGYLGIDAASPIPDSAKAGSETIWGISVQPSYYIIPKKLQFVLRFDYASAGFLGIRPEARYARRTIDATSEPLVRGTRYYGLYAGLNYYIYGDDLKLMLGWQWDEIDDGRRNGLGDFRSNTGFFAVRMQF